MLLQVDNLSVHYPTPRGVIRAVEDVYFNLDQGEIMGIIGESGSGKSTLGYALLNLLPKPGKIVSGSVLVEDRDVTSMKESEMETIRGKIITYVPQGAQNALNPLFTIEQQIADPIRHHQKLSYKEAVQKAHDCLEQVGIPKNRAKQYPHQYSGGMKQRALIAMALGLSAKLVILDEPTTALDVLIQKQVLDLIRQIRSKFNTSFLLISHDLSMVSSVCDKISIMYAGRFVENAATREIFSKPSHPYTRAFLDSLPRMVLSRTRLLPIQGAPPNLLRVPPGCPFHPRCAYVMNKCAEEVPPLVTVSEEHRAACFLFGS